MHAKYCVICNILHEKQIADEAVSRFSFGTLLALYIIGCCDYIKKGLNDT